MTYLRPAGALATPCDDRTGVVVVGGTKDATSTACGPPLSAAATVRCDQPRPAAGVDRRTHSFPERCPCVLRVARRVPCRMPWDAILKGHHRVGRFRSPQPSDRRGRCWTAGLGLGGRRVLAAIPIRPPRASPASGCTSPSAPWTPGQSSGAPLVPPVDRSLQWVIGARRQRVISARRARERWLHCRVAGPGPPLGPRPSAVRSIAQAVASTDDAPRAQRVPDFFIVGQPKTGTTALYEILSQHPQIYMPAIKEPDFFATDLRRRFTPFGADASPETLADYLALYGQAQGEQRTGDASVTTYLVSRVAAANIRAVRPDARIIAILREPASLLRSLHLQLLQTHDETEKNLERALDLEDARRAGRNVPRSSSRPKLLYYSDFVRYVDQLERYRTQFGGERMLVVLYDDFRRDNVGVVRSVFRFLEVSEGASVAPVEANPTVQLRSRRLDDLVLSVAVGRGAVTQRMQASIKALTWQSARRRALDAVWRGVVYGKPRPPDPHVTRALRRRFRAEVIALGDYLGRDLASLWGYD